MHPKCFFKIAWKSNNYQFYLTNFLKFCHNISHKLLRPSQFLKKKKKKLWNGPLYRNKLDPFPILRVAGCLERSNAEASKKKLPQILAKNIDNGVTRVGLRIYLRYCGLLSLKSECTCCLTRSRKIEHP